MPSAKLLALDVGDARIGVAVGSVLPNHAEPLATLKRAGGFAEDQILRLIEERVIDTVVVGLPLDEQGRSNEQCSKIEKFCRRLQRRTSAKIEFVDEYYSSADAQEIMKSAPRRKAKSGAKRGSKREGIDTDSVAATMILRRYLNDNTSC